MPNEVHIILCPAQTGTRWAYAKYTSHKSMGIHPHDPQAAGLWVGDFI